VRAPLVAVVAYHLPLGRVTKWDSGAYALPDTYVAALRRAGARPVLLSEPDAGPAEDILASFDGLVLAGGGDVDPARFGAEPHPKRYGVDVDRDALEIELVLAADRAGVPTLGICRGAQVVNVAFGGTLHQHLPDVAEMGLHGTPRGGPSTTHEVKVSESSRLYAACGRPTLECLSSHHQGIDQLGGGLIPVASTGDGLVEAVERPGGWMLAVQWHPEETAADDPYQQALFDTFAEQSRRAATGQRG
jgi:putative glutamine amidotransferase